MSCKNIGLSILVLLCVLNTYSLPTTTLYKAIQASKIPNCPVFRSLAVNTPEPDYLKDCPYPLDPKSNDLNIIRCNLYLNQFNFMCALSLPKFTSPLFLSANELYEALPTGSSDGCQMFSMPIMINNSTNIDSFIVNKCQTICTDIRTEQVDPICIAAAYFRMVANMLHIARTKSVVPEQTTQIDASGHAVGGIPQVNRVVPESDNVAQQLPEILEANRQTSHNFATSGNDVSPTGGATGNAAPEMSPTLTETHDVADDVKLHEEHESVVSSKGIGNVVISGGGIKTEEIVVNKTATVEHKKAPEVPPVVVPPKSEEISKSNEGPKQKSEISPPVPDLIPEKVQQVDSKSMTTPVKNDVIVEEANQQDTAAEADYSDKAGFDIDSVENNPPPDFESNVPSVARKHPGMTEDEDEKLASRNMYRDDRTVEDDSYFFTYFMMLCVVFIFAYVGYHNKQKIIAIVVEGRRGSSGGGRGGRSRGGRRPNSANYHKLDSNLEEAVSSNTPNKNTSKVIY